MGQDLNVIVAVFANILSWLVASIAPRWLPYLLPSIPEQDTQPTNLSSSKKKKKQTKCIVIGRPGGMEQLRLVTLQPGYVTVGYNVIADSKSPFVRIDQQGLPPHTVVVKIKAFSVNYADCCIRWGLYESANQFVGYPIVPGFDIAGTIEQVADDVTAFRVGDPVFGATFFGAYSTHVLVPVTQLKSIPPPLSMAQAASLPAVSLTALYALVLGGVDLRQSQSPSSASASASASATTQPSSPDVFKSSTKSILIHSAAGGVGSMLIQMSRVLQLSPIVGVVGHSSKVDTAKALGCTMVIDKSSDTHPSSNWWTTLDQVHPEFHIIMDANGVSTLQQSYYHLAPTGRLIIFGFHSNLPLGQHLLHPMAWIRVIGKKMMLPTFDPMDLVTSNKSLLGFNLSFFVDQIHVLNELFDHILYWISQEQIECPRIVEMEGFDQIGSAHEYIQSGRSIGKIVITVTE